MPVYAYYDFNDPDGVIRDSALDNGAQDGVTVHGAEAVDGRLQLDGLHAYGKIYSDPMFQADRGTLAIEFSQQAHVGDGANAVLSRDSTEHDSGFLLEVLADGSIRIRHESPEGDVVYQTDPGFSAPGDHIDLSYSWDRGGETPGKLVIVNQTAETRFEADVPNHLTMDMPSDQVRWLIGTNSENTPPGGVLPLQDFFLGSVGYLSFSDTVDNLNGAPEANDDAISTPEDTAVTIPVLANDSDPDGDALTITSVTVPEGQGSVSINPDGTLQYEPPAGFTGDVVLTYTVSDGRGGEDTAEVRVSVGEPNRAPDARDDLATTAQGTAVTVAVLANDTDPDGDALTITGASVPPEQGMVLVNPDGTVTFTPAPGFTGQAQIDYTVSDGAGGSDGARLTVTVEADPVAGARDGIVWGTGGSDIIDTGYTDDNDGDFIDNDDALLPGHERHDDYVIAGDGADTVHAGLGDDVVFGGRGDDFLHGDAGNDTLFGEAGDDELIGGEGNDLLDGGAGNDRLYGGPGADTLLGGDDRDVIFAGPGDLVDGGSGGDDWDTLDLTGMGPLRVWRDPENTENGHVTFFDEEGNTIGRTHFFDIEHIVPCFTPGTRIATPRGEIAVEELRVGDRVMTRDNGIQEVRWVGARHLSAAELGMASHLQPVMIRAGALGNGLPERDMIVSPNHRLLVANDRTALYFEEREVLVAAKHLVGAEGISALVSSGTTYLHFMCDRHEVVLSDGAWTETFQPGDQTLKGMGNAQRAEIFEIFPELQHQTGIEDYVAARKTLKRHEAVLLRG